MPKNKKILFMGTPKIAAQLLEALIKDGYHIAGVLTRLDAPIGRKQVLTPSPVKVVATRYNIPVYQFKRVRDDYEVLLHQGFEAIVCLAYGQLIPEELLKAMPLGSLNFHGSLLPKYRGAAPLQRAIMAGETTSGVTAMEMVKEMDAGVMYKKLEIPIAPDDNYTTYQTRFIAALIPFAHEILPLYCKGELKGEPQDEAAVSFAPMIKKEEMHLDLTWPKTDFINHMRGMNDEPGTYLLLDAAPLYIYRAVPFSTKVDHRPGTITKADKNGLILQLVDGEIALLEVQLPGKRRLGYVDFINGQKNLMGKILK